MIPVKTQNHKKILLFPCHTRLSVRRSEIGYGMIDILLVPIRENNKLFACTHTSINVSKNGFKQVRTAFIKKKSFSH